ncbi:MAG: SDR family NAD(P)-dependent oxidoreductase [Haliea sp.]|nr:SDR family NAD(P)-dependent oxidoreductase [Haliea sp.]
MQRFTDKVVFVTGAGSGIGKASALRLAAEGGAVFCVDLNREAVEATAAEIVAAGGEATARVCDVSDEASVQDSVDACISRYGSLHGLVNMAGILRFDDTEQLQTGDWQKLIAINLTGTVFLCRAVRYCRTWCKRKAASSMRHPPRPFQACPVASPIPPAKAACWR